MNKGRKYIRLFEMLTIGLLLTGGAVGKACAQENIGEENKIIYIVYDNSSSTYVYGEEYRDYWEQINYGVQCFYAMTNEEDKIKISFLASDDVYSWDGYGGTDGSVDMIREIKVHPERYMDKKSVTYMSHIKKAIEELAEEPSEAEKWIIIFTDGKLEDVNADGTDKEYSEKETADLLHSYLSHNSDINACYIPVDKEAENRYLKENLIFQPQETNSIEGQLLEVCNHIYRRRTIQKVNSEEKQVAYFKEGNLTVEFDIPIRKCVLYAYCSGSWEEDQVLGCDEIIDLEYVRAPKELLFIGGVKQNLEEEESSDEKEKKTGVVAELRTHPSKNITSYNVIFPGNVSDIVYDIYYEPAYKVMLEVEKEGERIERKELLEGKYDVVLEAENEETGEKIPETAKFMSVEEFDVKLLCDQKEIILEDTFEKNRWRGESKAGEVKLQAYMKGTNEIVGEYEVEFCKDYEKAELAIELENVYYMDRLEAKEQCIQVKVLLDGENVTDEIENMIKEKEDVQLIYSLSRGGDTVETVDFERQYDPDASCWKLYPFFVEDVDFSLSDNYDFSFMIKADLDYYDHLVEIKSKNENFCVGVSGDDGELRIENPWVCRPKGFLFPMYERTELSFWWDDKKLPAGVLEEVRVEGQSNGTYKVFKGKERIEIRYGAGILSGWKNENDILKVEGVVKVFGKEKSITDSNIEVIRYGVSKRQLAYYITLYIVIVVLTVVIIFKIVRYFVEVRSGRRLGIRVKVKSRLNVTNGMEEIPDREGRIYWGKRIKDESGVKHIVHKIIVYLVEEFGARNNQIELEVERSKDQLIIWSIEIPENCENIYLGDIPYKGSKELMGISKEIKLKLKDKDCITGITFENT